MCSSFGITGCPCSVYTRQRTKAVSCSTPITLATRLSGNRYVRAMATQLSGNRSALGDGSHLADSDTFLGNGFSVVAFAFYNVGINNMELLGTKWQKGTSTKKEQLKIDIKATFEADVGIQALFISEFGGMCPNIDEEVAGMTKDFCGGASRH